MEIFLSSKVNLELIAVDGHIIKVIALPLMASQTANQDKKVVGKHCFRFVEMKLCLDLSK